MFLSIVLITAAMGILFLTALIALITFIVNSIKKNSVLQGKSLRVLIPSAIFWFILIGIDVFLTITYLHTNGRKILDKSIEISSEIASQSLTSTFQSFEKNWDKKRLAQLENLKISLESIEFEIENDMKKYTIGMVFDNTSPMDVKLYFDDLLGNNYLSACDKNDFVYLLKLKDKTNAIISFGKSRYYFVVEVAKDIEINHIRYISKDIMLE